jgi:hypothetical protein
MPPIKIDLPILTAREVAADQARGPRTNAEKYGGLFWLSLAGLAVILGLVGWFGWSVWSLRDVWQRVHVLNDSNRTMAERIEAAHALSRDRRVLPRQRWDLCLSLEPPELARSLLAESLDGSALEGDASAYALAVARSEGWPDWLRLQLVRPLAYGAGRYALPAAPLEELRRHSDRAIQLWAIYAQAAGREDAGARAALIAAAREDQTRYGELARLLAGALTKEEGSQPQAAALDLATKWARDKHPATRALWQGREERDGRLVPSDAPR